MGITIGDAPSSPGIVYDKVFLVRLNVVQEWHEVDSDPDVYNSAVKYILFGVDQNGKRHKEPITDPDFDGVYRARISDFLAFAQLKIEVDGNYLPLTSFGSLQELISLIVAEDRQTTTTVF